MAARNALLRRNLERSFRGAAWHGPTLAGSLRGVGAEEAAWRPQPGRHNIWELAVHAAYWKYRVRRRLTDAEPRSFDLAGSDWFERPGGDEDGGGKTAWRADRERLTAWHEHLCEAVAAFDPAGLSEHPGNSQFSFEDHVLGAAAHDAYHAGQIRLLRRMWAER